METVMIILLVGVLLALLVNIMYLTSIKKYISQEMTKDIIIMKLLSGDLKGMEILKGENGKWQE